MISGQFGMKETPTCKKELTVTVVMFVWVIQTKWCMLPESTFMPRISDGTKSKSKEGT